MLALCHGNEDPKLLQGQPDHLFTWGCIKGSGQYFSSETQIAYIEIYE